jgi:hypothetical protein
MAKANYKLIESLRNTAESLKKSTQYQWGHMGSCNCGFLAQEVAQLNRHQIHARAMQRYGDWNEQLNDYCPTSGLLMDDLISELLNLGLDIDDLKKLEKLSDHKVLGALRGGKRHLIHNKKDDVVEYLETWADLLEAEMIDIESLLPSKNEQIKPVLSKV